MVWLVLAPMVCAAIYFWLIGNWFGQVVMFLLLIPVLAVLCGMIGQAIGVAMFGPPKGLLNAGAYLGALAGAIAAWPVSRLPMMHWEANARMMARY